MPEVYPRAPRGSFSRRLTLTAHRDRAGTLEPLCHPSRAAGPGLCPMPRGLVHYHLGFSQLRTRQVGRELQRPADSPPK